MNFTKNWFDIIQKQATKDFSLFGMRLFILAWAIGVIILSWVIDDKWVLAGIIAYEVLP